MLNQPKFQFGDDAQHSNEITRFVGNPFSSIDVIGIAKRQFWVLAWSVVAGIVIGLAYIVQAIPSYTSSVSILIDAKKVGMTAASPLEGSLTFESGAVDSQLQILTSDKLAGNVVQRLGLQNNIAFLDPEPSPLGATIRTIKDGFNAVTNFVTSAPPQPEIMDLPENLRLLMATGLVLSRMKVERVGRTYVFALDYTDRDPVLAQAVAGQFANAYLEDQLDSKFDSTKRATNWMEERIRDLRARSLAADEAVQKYRADNNLIAASGRLIDEQSLTDATTQLTAARSALDTASARYQRLKQIVDTKDLNGSLTESLTTPNVAALRAKYLEAAKLASEISARYGENHQAAIKARKDMVEYTSLIFDELTNLLPGYQSEVAIAQSQVSSIQATIDQLRQASTVNDSAMVKLRALEQESDTLKTLYSTFLQKSQELQQQQSFPVTDARVISDASTPLLPSGPRKLLIMLATMFLGVFVGTTIGFLREWRDRGFRTGIQVRDELGLEFITNVPLLRGKGNVVNTQKAAPALDANQSKFITADPVLQEVVNEPFSQFSEAIRALRSKAMLGFSRKRGSVIGVVSMFPDEGKSTVAKNLASSLALQGTKTILIDGDFRNPTLTNALSERATAGFVDVLQGGVAFAEAVREESESGLSFLPGATRRKEANDVFGSERASRLVEELRQNYDLVVIDFPPFGALTDAVAASSIVDGYFLIVQWGKTPRHILRDFMDGNRGLRDKILGVALNKVDLRRLRRYGAYQGSSAYSKYSEKYFADVSKM